MATLGQLVSNSLWFAFDALDQQKAGTVPKSQLKVLTQNIGVLLRIDRRVEECIADYLSVDRLSFDQFLFFLVYEVFSEVDSGTTPYRLLKKHHDVLEDAFWEFTRPFLLARDQPVLTAKSVYRIFRIFCCLADKSNTKGGLLQVSLSRGEVEEVTRDFVEALGRVWDPDDFQQLADMIPTFTLPVFLTFLEGRYCLEVEAAASDAATEDVFRSYIEQILMSSKVHQRLPWAPVWIPRELETVPWEIRGCRGLITNLNVFPAVSIQPQSSVHNIADTPGAMPCRFTLCTENKMLQLAAPDHRTKSKWLRALDIAIQNCDELVPYQMLLSAARKEDRAMEEERQIAEKIRRASQADIIERTQAELVAERLARAEAEIAAREEAEARAAEKRRVEELTRLRKQLEKLLEEETQAKRDEEIVRNLQARVLREEWEKREELEHLQAQQRKLLEEETRKRKAFEKLQDEKEKELRTAQQKLQVVERERLRLDRELRTAREKIVTSERSKELVEAKMKVKERTPPARTLSLRPIRREQGRIPLRSSSFNTHITVGNPLPPVQDNSHCETHSSSEERLIDPKEKVPVTSQCPTDGVLSTPTNEAEVPDDAMSNKTDVTDGLQEDSGGE